MGLVALMGVGVGPGCGQKPEEVPAAQVDLSKVGGNGRLKAPGDEYKKMIGKDGRVMMKPGMMKGSPGGGR